MKILMVFFMLLVADFCSGQTQKLTDEQINASGAMKLTFAKNLSQARALAKMDIANELPFLLLQSGIAPVTFPTDGKFEKNYKIFYLESGCTGPTFELAIEYDKVIFEYLNTKYNKKWQRNIRKDVIGFKEFKRNKQRRTTTG